MQTFLWIYIFLAGCGAILAVTGLARLVQFLFGGSSRLDRLPRPGQRRRGALMGISSRVVFFLWSLMLVIGSLAMIAISRGDDRLNCWLMDDGPHTRCDGFAGADAAAWLLSLPSVLADYTGAMLRALQSPQIGAGEGLPPILALGLIGPLLLLLAWLGFARMLGDVRRLWRGR